MCQLIAKNEFIDKYCQADLLLVPISVCLGFAVGLTYPGNEELSHKYRTISSVLGWVYFFLWAVSFWPQVITNYKSKSTIGLAPDKLLYDIIGFGCLTLYESFMFFVPVVREAYQYVHDGKEPEVEINDVYFAAHALLLTFIVIGQMVYYDGYKQMPSKSAIILSSVLTVIIFVSFAAVIFRKDVDCQLCNFLNWLYLLSAVKVFITILKFYPQVMSNYRRKATQGWNIYGTWMDLIGSVLSILQLILDCNDQKDWNGVGGNFVKIALGIISGSYDMIFCIQHYIIYPNTGDDYALRQKRAAERGLEMSYSQLDSTEHGVGSRGRSEKDSSEGRDSEGGDDVECLDMLADDLEEVVHYDFHEEAYFAVSN